jgi:hypothetical protein
MSVPPGPPQRGMGYIQQWIRDGTDWLVFAEMNGAGLIQVFEREGVMDLDSGLIKDCGGCGRDELVDFMEQGKMLIL